MSGRPYIPRAINSSVEPPSGKSRRAWLPLPVADDILLRIYDVGKWAPTGCNSKPAHLVFVRSASAKARLAPVLGDEGREQIQQAPVTVIVAQDPGLETAGIEGESVRHRKEAANVQDATLQGAYFIMAARALGLQVWPMMGLDNAGVDEVFFRDLSWKTNFVFALGYGDDAGFPPRIPHSSFLEACRIE